MQGDRMDESRITLREKWFYLFPLLVAIYPIFFLYSYNVQELLLSQITMPVIIALGGTVLFWVCLALLVKDTLKAGVIITIFILFFYSYGLFFDWLVSLHLFTVKHRHVLPVFLIIAAYLGYFVSLVRSRELFVNAAKILTVIVTVMLVLSISSAIPYEVKKWEYFQQNLHEKQLTTNLAAMNQSGEYPDIYYIILDEYASSSTIKEIWGYDNRDFENHLKNQGFFIADNSSVRYFQTEWSLLTSLNMDYPGGKISHADFYNLTMALRQDEYINISTIEMNQRINYNNVSEYLKNKGYTLIVLDALETENPAQGMMRADKTYLFRSEEKNYLIDSFTVLLIRSTILRPSENFDLFSLSSFIKDPEDLHRNTNLYILNELKDVNKIPGPKYVFVHLLIPHSPFVFNENGGTVEKTNSLNWNNKKYYRDQYIFTTRQISLIIDEILKNSKRPPVIILQSDHGPRPFNGRSPEENLDIPIDDMFRIFNAYYFPGANQSIFYRNISPVNSFRLVFNTYFDENYPLLEDE
jgi:hypothetical protein